MPDSVSLWASAVNFTKHLLRLGTGRVTQALQCFPSKTKKELAEGPKRSLEQGFGEEIHMVCTVDRFQLENLLINSLMNKVL